jgi:UDP-N-acetyl-2-amino-2-deoxyglucuronate dehydrogenase
MTEHAPIRIALVGCGRISQNHCEAIARIDGLELVAVCDVVEERARTAGERWGVRHFTSYEQMLAEVPCEAVANATVRWTRPQEYYEQAPWRGTWEFDGGAFMNQASHYVDLIQWLVGPVESVMAKTATMARRIEAEDSGAAILKFRNGAIGVIEVTMLTFPKNLEGSFTILGEKGTVRIGGTAVNRIEHWQFADYDDDDKLVEAANTAPPSVYGFGHEPYYRNVLRVLHGEAVPDTDGRGGRKSLELVLGIYESAKTGREVPLPLRPHL